MKKIDFSNSKVKKLLTGKGFYVALCICIVAIMAVVYISYRATLDNLTKTPSVQPRANASSDAGTDANVSKTDDNITVDKPEEQLRIMPLNGDVLKPFSDKQPLKSTTKMWATHPGVDIKAMLGDPVKSIATGTVKSVTDNDKYGVTVEIDHGNGMVARYCNLNATTLVKENDTVAAGTVIGSVGDTSLTETDTTHLHLEIRVNNIPVDPIELLKPSK